MARSLRNHWIFIVLLIAFLATGVAYSVITPLFESPDEVWHFEYVRYLAEGHGLPVASEVSEMPWNQEGSQPPLYYLIGSGLTAWIDTSDAGQVIRYNPHAEVGQADAADNLNILAHSSLERFPYQGTVLAAHILRIYSLLVGAGTVTCTYLLALEVTYGQRWLAILAAAINGFNPQFLFISSSVNNDNAVILLCSIALLLCVRLWRQVTVHAGLESGSLTIPVLPLVAIGATVGMASLSKLNGLMLVPMVAVVLLSASIRLRSWRLFVLGGATMASATLVVAGWWYLRNLLLYGEPLGLSAMYMVLPARSSPPTLSELLERAPGVWRSFWAVFGWFNVSVAPRIYTLYSCVTLLAIAGLVLSVTKWRRRPDNSPDMRSPVVWLIIWVLTVVAGLVWWSQRRYPQGRLLFPAISAFALLVALGLSELVGCLTLRFRRVAGLLLVIILLALAAWMPIGFIAPAYAQPALVFSLPLDAAPVNVCLGDQICLEGVHIESRSVSPGDHLEVALYWRRVAPVVHNYSVYLHVIDENDLIVAQRDSYPAGGGAVTSDWPEGCLIVDVHRVRIPATTQAYGQLRLIGGLYDHEDGQRLRLTSGADSVDLGAVDLIVAMDSDGTPGQIKIEFEEQLALVGYDLSDRTIEPGDTLDLQLHWECLSPLDNDYTIFTHLVLPPDQVWAQHDSPAVYGGLPTSSWTVGQGVLDPHVISVPIEAPPGVYEIQIGVYIPETGQKLKIGSSDKELVLAKVRVD